MITYNTRPSTKTTFEDTFPLVQFPSFGSCSLFHSFPFYNYQGT